MASLSACESTLMKPGNCSSMKITRLQEKNLTIFWSHYFPSLEVRKENSNRGCLSILPGILKMSMMQWLRQPLKISTQRKNLTLLSHVVIMLLAGMVLQFITGSYQVPALKFDPVLSVQFLHNVPGRKMNANTSSNTLTLPVTSKYLDYNLFQEEFTTCIFDSPGFGNV